MEPFVEAEESLIMHEIGSQGSMSMPGVALYRHKPFEINRTIA